MLRIRRRQVARLLVSLVVLGVTHAIPATAQTQVEQDSPLEATRAVGTAADDPVELRLQPGTSEGTFRLFLRNTDPNSGASFELFAWADIPEEPQQAAPSIVMTVAGIGDADSNTVLVGPSGQTAVTITVSGVDRPGNFSAVLAERATQLSPTPTTDPQAPQPESTASDPPASFRQIATLELVRPFMPKVSFLDADGENVVKRTVRSAEFELDLVIVEAGDEVPPAPEPVALAVSLAGGSEDVPLLPVDGVSKVGSAEITMPPAEIDPGRTATIRIKGVAPDRTAYRTTVTMLVGEGPDRQVVRSVLEIERSALETNLSVKVPQPPNRILWIPSWMPWLPHSSVDVEIRVAETPGRDLTVAPPDVSITSSSDESSGPGPILEAELFVKTVDRLEPVEDACPRAGSANADAAPGPHLCDVEEGETVTFVYRIEPGGAAEYAGSVSVGGPESARVEAAIEGFKIKDNPLLAIIAIGIGVFASYGLWRRAGRRDRRIRAIAIAREDRALDAMLGTQDWRENRTVRYLRARLDKLATTNEFGSNADSEATAAKVNALSSVRVRLEAYGLLVDHDAARLGQAHRQVTTAADLEAAASALLALIEAVPSTDQESLERVGEATQRLAEPPKTELIAQEVRRGDRRAYLLLAGVSIVTGFIALWGGNETFGSIVDYATALIWGFGVTEATKGIANVAQALNITP